MQRPALGSEDKTLNSQSPYRDSNSGYASCSQSLYYQSYHNYIIIIVVFITVVIFVARVGRSKMHINFVEKF
jgi:hypothetical protein